MMIRSIPLAFLFLVSGLLSCAQNPLQEINNLLYLDPDQVTVDSLQRLNLVLPEKAEIAHCSSGLAEERGPMVTGMWKWILPERWPKKALS